MSYPRKIVFANGEIYHVFNRGVEKREIFSTIRDYRRAQLMLWYYQYASPPIRFSQYLDLNDILKKDITKRLQKEPKLVRFHSYCLMPNHFHLVIEQLVDGGITRFMNNISNSHARYYNEKHERVGGLYQGIFKAIHIDSDDFLIHVSRYVHINPTTAFLIEKENILDYQWSSLREFVDHVSPKICDTSRILSHFSSSAKYKEFVLDQVDYARSLHHLPIDKLEYGW